MAKKSQKRHVQYEKDHSGCIWGLVSMFDFRHGRNNRKLISDRRCENKHSGTGITNNRFEVLSNLDENSQETIDRNETRVSVRIDAKPSVKELMEVEMVGEQEIKEETNNADVESKGSNSVLGGQKKRRRNKKKKPWSKSGSIEIKDSVAPENMGSVLLSIQTSGNQSMKDLNVDDMMEEFCRQIRQKGISLEEDEQNSKGGQKNKEIREFLHKKVIHNEEITGDENMKELIDIFQLLNLDKELFVKLIQDPNSTHVNYARSCQDPQNGESDSLPASTLPEHQSNNIRKSEELINNKRRNFFRKMVKSKERSLLTEKTDVNASKRIVILKPSPNVSQISETENSLGSSSESNNVISKSSTKKTSSYFSFTKFRGKLMNAVGKEGHKMYTENVECQKIGDGEKTNSLDNIGKSSPGKDHFFIERFAKPSTSVKRGDRSKAKGANSTNERGTARNSGKKVSNLYIEAKRHLSEMLSTGVDDAESSSRRVPRTLGRILSLPEYSMSPINSPKVDYKYDITVTGSSGHNNDQMVNNNRDGLKEENEECHPHQATDLEVEISANDHDNKPQTQYFTSNTKNGLIYDSIVEITSPVTEEIYPEGDTEIPKATTDIHFEDCSSIDASCKPSSTSTIDGQNEKLSEVPESYEDNQMPSLESPPPSCSWSNKKAEEKEGVTCTQERPSPVSVLEPLSMEDDISPERTICKRESELPVQPLCIRFEECEPYPSLGTCSKNYQDKEIIIEYVNAILQPSELKWDELYLGSISSDHLLERSLFDKLEHFNYHEQKLLFDIINEVLREVYERYFAYTVWVAFVKPGIRPSPSAKDITNEVCKAVSWHLVQIPQSCTLNKIVRKDMSRSDYWLDLRSDAENIGFGMGEAILDDLLDETILSFLRECQEDFALPAGSSEVESPKCKT